MSEILMLQIKQSVKIDLGNIMHGREVCIINKIQCVYNV